MTQTDAELLKGVFSTEVKQWIGAGATKRKVVKEELYFAEELESGEVRLTLLNDAFIPSGEKTLVVKEDFTKTFKPEPEIYTKKTLPALKELTKTIAKAERHRAQGAPLSAEFEYGNALKMDAANIRALFGLGLVYLDKGDAPAAGELMSRLVELSEAFEPQNKALFNEFGVKLRKSKLYDQALGYYAKAFKISQSDENLCFNIARTLVEKGDFTKAKGFVDRALALNPNFSEAAKLLDFIVRKIL